MIKKLICMILAGIMLFTLISCKDDPVESESQTETEQTETPHESLEDTETETEEPEVVLTVGDLSKYVIVRPMKASDAAAACAGSLMKSLNEKFSLGLEVKGDAIVPGNDMFKETEHEILLGACNREVCAGAADGLKHLDYSYGLVGTKLVICAGSDEALAEAVKAFKENVIDKADTAADAIFFSSVNDKLTYAHSYPLEDIRLNGASIGEYTLVYPSRNTEKESEVATVLKNRILALTGFELPVVKDTVKRDEDGKEIHIGVINDDKDFAEGLKLSADESYIGDNGKGNVLVTAGSAAGVLRAADILASGFEVESSDKVLELDANMGRVRTEDTDRISIMTYNIQMWAPWTAGKPEATMQVIIDKSPDIFGLQEATLGVLDYPDWISILKTQFGDTYGCVDLASNGIKPEDYPITDDPIFYRKDKFELIESGSKWLSDTPDVASKFEAVAAVRIMNYALLERKSDGFRFVVANTHLDHVACQAQQAEVLVQLLERFSEYPILSTGDYNFTLSSGGYRNIINAGFVSSKPFCLEKINANVGTKPSGAEIDFCFNNGRSMYFYVYEVINDKTFLGDTPSDHYAVYFEFKFCK